jgi:hypothetical protein
MRAGEMMLARTLNALGWLWCVGVVIAYFAYGMFSEHGGGLLSQEGYGEVWLIALACLPGVALVKLASRYSPSS